MVYLFGQKFRLETKSLPCDVRLVLSRLIFSRTSELGRGSVLLDLNFRIFAKFWNLGIVGILWQVVGHQDNLGLGFAQPVNKGSQ